MSTEQNDSRLSVGIDFWPGGAEEGERRLAEVERTEPDEVSLTIMEGAAIFMSKAAAREIGQQLVIAAGEDWRS